MCCGCVSTLSGLTVREGSAARDLPGILAEIAMGKPMEPRLQRIAELTAGGVPDNAGMLARMATDGLEGVPSEFDAPPSAREIMANLTKEDAEAITQTIIDDAVRAMQNAETGNLSIENQSGAGYNGGTNKPVPQSAANSVTSGNPAEYAQRMRRQALREIPGFADEADDLLDMIGLTPERFRELVQLPAEELSEAERSMLKAIRNAVPAPTADTILQKVIPGSRIDAFIQNGQSMINGFVSRAVDTKQLQSYNDYRAALRLDYTYKDQAGNAVEPFPENGGSLGVIRFTTEDVDSITIPYGQTMGGTMDLSFPFTGSGFTAAENGQTIPESCFVKSIDINSIAELYEIDRDGTETLRSIYDPQMNQWLIIR